jgi:hypothetical protein
VKSYAASTNPRTLRSPDLLRQDAKKQAKIIEPVKPYSARCDFASRASDPRILAEASPPDEAGFYPKDGH